MRYGWLVILAAVPGCLTTGYTPIDLYSVAPAVEVAAVASTEQTLGIRPLEAARPYRQRIVYREAGYVLGYYENAEWAELPRDAVTRSLSDAIVATGRFADVGNAADMRAPDFVLTGELRKFDQVRSETPWVAECEIRLELRDPLGRAEGWARTFTVREPLDGRSLPEHAAAMSRAVAAIVNEAAEAIGRR